MTTAPSGGTTTDAARYLRDTANLMRERAEAATQGRWRAQTEPSTLYDQPGVYGPWDEWVAECGPIDSVHAPEGRGDKDAEHIASWDPDVARAVADLLDDTAAVWETRGWGYDRSPIPPENKVLALARAYRREVVPCDVVPREAT